MEVGFLFSKSVSTFIREMRVLNSISKFKDYKYASSPF